MNSQKFLVWALAALYLISGAECGLDIETAKEEKCFDIPESNLVKLNLTWVDSIRTLYYPVMSKLELYKTATDLAWKDLKDITDHSLKYESCFYWNMDSNGTMISRGFNSKPRGYISKLLSPHMEKFWFGPVEGKGYSGMAFTTMTDNKTYMFLAICGDDGEMSWGLASVLPDLPKETIKLVYDHAESLGFKRKFFTEFKYDRCNFETTYTDVVRHKDEVFKGHHEPQQQTVGLPGVRRRTFRDWRRIWNY